MAKISVCILMGSRNDFALLKDSIDVFKEFDISFEMRVTSAHRTPERTIDIIKAAEADGAQIFICAAGMAAHLAGVVAAHTLKPVIGVPLDAGPLQGMDALLSTVQMPKGIPVACMAVGKAGAVNAAYYCAHILSLQDPALMDKISQKRQSQQEFIKEQDSKLSDDIKSLL